MSEIKELHKKLYAKHCTCLDNLKQLKDACKVFNIEVNVLLQAIQTLKDCEDLHDRLYWEINEREN